MAEEAGGLPARLRELLGGKGEDLERLRYSPRGACGTFLDRTGAK